MAYPRVAVPIQPEDLSISALPRSPLPGGIKPQAATDLLERVASDYRDALAEAERLSATITEQARRIKELEAQIVSRTDLDELARGVLASAQRIAREQREQARQESELLLKKAERRAQRIELDAHRRVEDGLSELEQLEAFRKELSVRLRSTLEAIVALGGDGVGSHGT
jgi:cell division septum initiation protein DivIVA